MLTIHNEALLIFFAGLGWSEILNRYVVIYHGASCGLGSAPGTDVTWGSNTVRATEWVWAVTVY